MTAISSVDHALKLLALIAAVGVLPKVDYGLPESILRHDIQGGSLSNRLGLPIESTVDRSEIENGFRHSLQLRNLMLSALTNSISATQNASQSGKAICMNVCIFVLEFGPGGNTDREVASYCHRAYSGLTGGNDPKGILTRLDRSLPTPA